MKPLCAAKPPRLSFLPVRWNRKRRRDSGFHWLNGYVIREAFPADLLGAAAFAHGVNELDAIRVDDAEDCRGGQEDLRPVVMRLEETKEPGTLGEAGKQRPIITRQPAIEGPVADAFEGMQQPQGDHLTGPEVGLGMFGDGAQLLIDLIEQCRD